MGWPMSRIGSDGSRLFSVVNNLVGRDARIRVAVRYKVTRFAEGSCSGGGES